MKTIARNATRKIQAIKDRNPTCQVLSLRNDFARVDCDADAAWGDLDRFSFARLVEVGPNNWRITVHGNLWYELHAAATPDAGGTASAPA